MDIRKTAKYNEDKIKGIFRTFAARFTMKQHLLIALAIVLVMLVLCVWVFSTPVKMFIYYILLILFGFQFFISWFTHAEKYAKEDTEEEKDMDLAAETAETIEEHRRRRTTHQP